MSDWKLDIGATVLDQGKVRFRVWAPMARNLSVRLISGSGTRDLPMERDERGYFSMMADNAWPGDLYFYLLENEIERPDPTSRFQPRGVHGPSQIIDPAEFQWDDDRWKGLSLKNYILYELHVGTFTEEGTFESVIPCLDYLKGLGITAMELMPVAQFPGSRNWGYDGVHPFAPQNSYGGVAGLKRLVNECHKKGIAVVLDVVYNHLGPEGNYLSSFGYYFTDKYRTPWGEAINFDGPYSDEVRRYFIDNALCWITEYHIDAIRIDAIHGIFDFSARHFLEDLGEAVHRQAERLSRKIYVIPESDLNDVRVINPRETGGYGLDAQWNDDFHHALHTLLTGEEKGYYRDFGKISHLEKTYREGFVYSGQYSEFRKRRHGSSSKEREAHQFIVFSQNHDQVGNRLTGDRLSQTQSFEKLKLAAGVVLLSPYIPLLFMGEEYGEAASFQYFVSHSDESLIEAVRKGRREEFASFQWEGEVPDPQAETIFLNSKINRGLHLQGRHHTHFRFYQELIRLRKGVPPLGHLNKKDLDVRGFEEERLLYVRRWYGAEQIFCLYNFNETLTSFQLSHPHPIPPEGEGKREGDRVRVGLSLSMGKWIRIIDSASPEWDGPGSLSGDIIESGPLGISLQIHPHSFVVYRMEVS